MQFQKQIARVVAAGPTPWTQDVLPQDANGNFLPPGTLAANTSNGALPDTAFSLRPLSTGGWPCHRLVVGYNGPAGAPILGADLYLYEKKLSQYYKVNDFTRVLRPGRLVVFDLTAFPDPSPTYATLDQAVVGGLDLVLIPNVLLAANMVAGTYYFNLSPGLSATPELLPNPDDEANTMVAITPNDGAANLSLPYGPCRWIWCADTTAGHTIKILTADDVTGGAGTQITVTGTQPQKLPFRAVKVFATGTSASPIYAAY